MSQRNNVVLNAGHVGLGHKEKFKKTNEVVKHKVAPHRLTDKVGETVTQYHLNRLWSAQPVLQTSAHREYQRRKGVTETKVTETYLVYFLTSRSIKWMDLDTFIYHKREKEFTYVKFLLEKRAEVTQGWNPMLREWLDKIEVQIDDIYKRMYNKKIPPFRLMHFSEDGTDKEIEQNIL